MNRTWWVIVLDTSDPMSCIRYRIAYGEASRLFEIGKFDHAWGRDFATRTENQAGAILKEVSKRLNGFDPELVQLAVEDALAGRRPRW